MESPVQPTSSTSSPRPGCRISYWVLVPEVGTDAVVAALRSSWLRGLQPTQAHYCVANSSASRDGTLLRLPMQRELGTPTSRGAFFGNGRLLDPVKREVYNSFLRRKVFAVVQAMSTLAVSGTLDYGVLLDADTAINVTNLEQLARAIPGGGDAMVYTGRCQQEALPAASGSDARSGRSYRRYDVARYIETRRRHGRTVPWPSTIPPSPGGGPGLLLSRGLLVALHRHLGSCTRLTEWNAMGDTIFAGGDSMLTRCFATLGVRCSTERDILIDAPERCPFAHGCALAALFRKNPPWFYQAAGQQRRALRMAQHVQPAETLGLSSPLHEAVAFHHVKPTTRAAGMEADPRCAVRMRADPQGRAGWFSSFCLPHFCLIGAPHVGTNDLMRALRLHPEVTPPSFTRLDFFATHGLVQQLLADVRSRPTAEQSGAAGASSPADMVATEPVASDSWARLLRLYVSYFPAIDPRDYRLTGEATTTYLYSAAAPSFFAHSHFRLLRVVLILREPAARALAELSAADAAFSPQSRVAAVGTLRAARRLALRCGLAVLYASCEPCVRATGRNPTVEAAPSSPCALEVSRLRSASDTTWAALWRSWYHLFLPRWLSLRPLVLFTEDLHGASAPAALRKLGAFLRLEPPVLGGLRLGGDGAAGFTSNVSAEAISLRELTSDAVSRTDALLQRWGKPGVPFAWKR